MVEEVEHNYYVRAINHTTLQQHCLDTGATAVLQEPEQCNQRGDISLLIA